MSSIKDTTNLKAYRVLNTPTMDDSLLPFIMRELRNISATQSAMLVALKSIEARIVVGGL
jgi:hypothetical protein